MMPQAMPAATPAVNSQQMAAQQQAFINQQALLMVSNSSGRTLLCSYICYINSLKVKKTDKSIFPCRLSRWQCRRWHCPRSSSRKTCENVRKSQRGSHHVSGGALLHAHVHLHAHAHPHPHPNPEDVPRKKEPFLRPPKKPQRPFQSPAVQRYRNRSVL